jgi:sodium-dependent phosphate cotransporter
MLCVLVFLPLNWIYPVFEKMTYEMAKNQKTCDGEDCNEQQFLKPYISPYEKGVAGYDKNVAKYISQNWCAGQCGKSYSSSAMKKISEEVCVSASDCSNVHANYEANWMSGGSLAKKRAPAYVVGKAASPAEFHYSKPSVGCDSVTKFFDNDTNFTSVVAGSLTAGTCYEVCGSKVKTGLCDLRLLKGGLLDDEWNMTDNGAGTFLTIVSLTSLCSCLF